MTTMAAPSITLPCPAKVNWLLYVGHTRPDGYHEVTTTMQAITLSDTLTLALSPQSTAPLTLSITGTITGVAALATDATTHPEKNLVGKAVNAFWKTSGLPAQPILATLEKTIPMQAGLGGGSSNAAGALYGLNQLLGNPLPPQTLITVAGTLGADVAFFVHRYCDPQHAVLLATGKGEQLTPLKLPPTLPSLPILVVKPNNVGVSTPQAYQWLDDARPIPAKNTPLTTASTAHQNALASLCGNANATTYTQWVASLANDFHAPILAKHPELANITKTLHRLGAQRVLLTGSGSALVALWPWGNLPPSPGALQAAAIGNTQATITLCHTQV